MSYAVRVGQRLPPVALGELINGEVRRVPLEPLLAGRRAVVFGIPGAFTPICSQRHAPEFIAKAPALRKSGIDLVICIGANDPWTMAAWADSIDPTGQVRFLSDGNLEFAHKTGLIESHRDYFLGDTDYPAKLEPNGSDFLSPALMEADLMRRVLPPQEFAAWFEAYLPAMRDGQPKNLLTIAVVTDRSDPQLGHLDGLNLSRAWAMRHIAAALPDDSRARAFLADAAHTHAVDALQHVATGHYEGEHWLASFAVFLLTEAP